MPAQQSLSSRETAPDGRELGLVDLFELAVVKRLAQLLLKGAAQPSSVLQRRREGKGGTAPRRFRTVQRNIGRIHHIRGMGTAQRMDPDADAQAQLHGGAVMYGRGTKRLDDWLRHLDRHTLVLPMQQHREFIPARTGDHDGVAGCFAQARSHRAQHRVPGRMTRRAVQRVEAVQIQKHQPVYSGNGIRQRVVPRCPVRQARQRTERGNPKQAILVPLSFGHVSNDGVRAEGCLAPDLANVDPHLRLQQLLLPPDERDHGKRAFENLRRKTRKAIKRGVGSRIYGVVPLQRDKALRFVVWHIEIHDLNSLQTDPADASSWWRTLSMNPQYGRGNAHGCINLHAC
nr:hypothetical protein [Falsirhodobacter deserti]